jgi:predicted lipid-binding transport protein (Tim44 family)
MPFRFFEPKFRFLRPRLEPKGLTIVQLESEGARRRIRISRDATSGERMKKVLLTMLIALLATTMGISSAQAKRLGGGGSFGKQSQSARQAPAQSSQASNVAKSGTPAAAPKPSSPWKGILGGALLGLGLGALLSHLGLSGAMASMISTILMVALLGLAAMFIYRMVMRRAAANGRLQPAYARSGGAGAYGSNYGSNHGSAYRSPSSSTPAIGSGLDAFSNTLGSPLQAAEPVSYSPWGVPTDFDTHGFLRNAKTYFIRLQAAWDKADHNDIRSFTTPEMFAEIKMQVQERGTGDNHTDVVSLDAELLGIETIGDEYLASVRFNGTIRESEQAVVEPFTEIWNLSKPVNGDTGWLLAGIQQTH